MKVKLNYSLIICAIVVLILDIGCTKNDLKSTVEVVKNFKFSEVGIVKKSENEIPRSSVSSSWPSNKTQLKISGCGGFFNRSFAGPGYHMYPQDTIDVSTTVEGSTINVNVSAYDVPNRFTIYNTSGGLVASSPWMGFANYSGPWGASINTNPNGTLFFTKTSSSIYYLKVETSVNGTTDSYNASVSCVAPSSITKTYAGISIKYYASTGLLHFNTAADLAKVINSLDSSYEAYNANYESQYSNLTPEQLDAVDSINNFDEFYPFRQFETLFPGYASKRAQLEGIENTWLNNNLTGTDPDDVDPTFDDAENTIINTANKFIVGLPNPLTVVLAALASLVGTDPCFTNKGQKDFFFLTTERKVKLKVGIKALFPNVYTSAVGKVVSLKKKNGNGWKRSRWQLAVYLGGNLYNNQCSLIPGPPLNIRKPSPSGHPKKKSLRISFNQWGTNWYTKKGQLHSSFEALNLGQGTKFLE